MDQQIFLGDFMSKHTVAENEAIITNKMHELQEAYSHKDTFNHYILETLNSFAYRYFDQAMPAEEINSSELRVMATEKGIKEAIKIKNENLRAGIGELVKRVSKEEGPTIARELRVQMIKREPGRGGVAHVFARISWGHPEHTFTGKTFVEKMSVLKFDDDIFFRNFLARHLEEVCGLFD
jgi:hypothetical protein